MELTVTQLAAIAGAIALEQDSASGEWRYVFPGDLLIERRSYPVCNARFIRGIVRNPGLLVNAASYIEGDHFHDNVFALRPFHISLDGRKAICGRGPPSRSLCVHYESVFTLSARDKVCGSCRYLAYHRGGAVLEWLRSNLNAASIKQLAVRR